VSRRTAGRVAWSLLAASAAVGFAGTGLKLAFSDVVVTHFLSNDLMGIAVFFTAGIVGALVASRLPSNPIGWIFVGVAVSMGLSGLADGYVALATHEGRLGGLTGWVALYSSDAFVALFVALVFGLLLFPDGHLLSRRWRVVAWMGVAGLCLFLPSVVLRVGKLDGYPRIESPAGVDSPILSWIAAPGYFLFSFAAVAAAVSVVLRFRRSRGVERQQLTLLVAAGALAVTAFVVGGPVGALAGSEDLGITIMLSGILSIPAAMGVAMLRYRLYEIDRVISRTIVYGALTVILGAAYGALVLAGQQLFSSFAGGSNLAIAVSTLVVAALFLPLRSRVQRIVDRRFYRRRYDAQRTLDRFGARLRDQVELDRLRADLQEVVRETMQPAHVSLWLRKGTR
jgi:hypothetical protein